MEKDTFVITFTSLSIILLCFFIFLNSKSELSADREHAVLYSVAQQFAPRLLPTPTTNTSLDLSSTELFLPHSSIIRATAIPQLHQIISALRREHTAITVLGQTCVDAPSDSDFLERQQLALERNASLMRFIVDEGVRPRHILAESIACPDPVGKSIGNKQLDQYSFASGGIT